MNYAVASDDDQLSMFLAHSALINGLPTDAMAKISVFNRQLSKGRLVKAERGSLLGEKGSVFA